MSAPEDTTITEALSHLKQRRDAEAFVVSGGIAAPVYWQERARIASELYDVPIRSLLPTFTIPLRPGQPGYEAQEERAHWRSILYTAVARLCTCRTCSCSHCPGHTGGCVIHDMDFDDD